MSANTTIKFTTTPIKGNASQSKVRYQGQLMHNKTLDASSTRMLFAEYAHAKEPQSNLYIDLLGQFMADYLAQGYRLNFGPFSAGLALKGHFPSANAPFDATANSIAVELMPSSGVKSATSELKPVNVTEIRTCRIFDIYQQSPFEAYDTIATDGDRTIITTGERVWVHQGVEGEGVWIENDLGEKLLEGTVTSADLCQLRLNLSGHIDAGRYWFVIASRDLMTSEELLMARRRVTAK